MLTLSRSDWSLHYRPTFQRVHLAQYFVLANNARPVYTHTKPNTLKDTFSQVIAYKLSATQKHVGGYRSLFPWNERKQHNYTLSDISSSCCWGLKIKASEIKRGGGGMKGYCRYGAMYSTHTHTVPSSVDGQQCFWCQFKDETDLARDEWMAAGQACGLAFNGGGGRGDGRGYMNVKIKTDS